jgi:hypothetical protein
VAQLHQASLDLRITSYPIRIVEKVDGFEEPPGGGERFGGGERRRR